jgi:SHAQKYF class myb-like DNA-binding protein
MRKSSKENVVTPGDRKTTPSLPVGKNRTIKDKPPPPEKTLSSNAISHHPDKKTTTNNTATATTKKCKPTGGKPDAMFAQESRTCESPANEHAEHNNLKRKHEELETSKNKNNPEVEVGRWGNEQHRQFVQAIYDIGINHASPSVLLEHMELASSNMPNMAGSVTSERIKSHLQKHRKNKGRTIDEFMKEYDRWTKKAATVGAAARISLSSQSLLEMMGDTKLMGGELAAYLTFSVMMEEEGEELFLMGGLAQAPTDKNSEQVYLPSAMEYTQCMSGARIPFPILTEEESDSSLGISLKQIVGLLASIKRTLMSERQRKASICTDGAAETDQLSSADISLPDSIPPATDQNFYTQRRESLSPIPGTEQDLPSHHSALYMQMYHRQLSNDTSSIMFEETQAKPRPQVQQDN